jgi:hypothetical protein
VILCAIEEDYGAPVLYLLPVVLAGTTKIADSTKSVTIVITKQLLQFTLDQIDIPSHHDDIDEEDGGSQIGFGG